MNILKQKNKNLNYPKSEENNHPHESFIESHTSDELREKLKRAVEIEDYETAAALRDELKALEKKHDIKA
ncbi:UvrB/UvrC motif-containing protein [Treponema sp. OMZ 791]|nr:UvrB/UvrC motif-containing protein [Treponema sp. OMZ 791]